MPLPSEDTTPPVTKMRGSHGRSTVLVNPILPAAGVGIAVGICRGGPPASVRRLYAARPRTDGCPPRQPPCASACRRWGSLPWSPTADPHLSGIPARALEGAQVAERLPRLVGTLVVSQTLPACVDRFALLRAGRARAGGPADPADAPAHRPHARTRRLAGRARARRRCRGGTRRCAQPAARAQMRAALPPRAASSCAPTRPAGRGLDRAARPARCLRARACRVYAAATRSERLHACAAPCARHGASHHLVSSLDDVAWITCLRGSATHPTTRCSWPTC